MPKKLPSAVLRKCIFQAAYKPKLNFYELLYPAALKLKGYNDWQTNRLSVTLHDYKKHCALTINHNNFSYDWDYSGTQEYTVDIKEAIDTLPSALGLDSFNRLGFRQQFLIQADMNFEELNTVLNLKFLSQEQNLIDIFPQRIVDMSYVVISADEMIKTRVALGPMKKEEMTNAIQINQRFNFGDNELEAYVEAIASYPPVAFYLDIDVFRDDEEIPARQAAEFWEKAETKVAQLSIGLRDYVFSNKG